MGYYTYFFGKLKFDKPVTPELKKYINDFCSTLHGKRDVNKIKSLYPDWKSRCWNGDLGVDGEYFLNPEHDNKWSMGIYKTETLDDGTQVDIYTSHRKSVTNPKDETLCDDISVANKQPPFEYCHYIIDDSDNLVVNDTGLHRPGYIASTKDSIKFYYFIEWLNYLNEQFIKPSGYKLSGKIFWQGETDDDIGCIEYTDGICKTLVGSY